ncbi:MAG: hypothetical protein K2H01_09830 [Ruminococcus sp.]|nr:hypothetical protein [Ruminococcus sp.]
MKKHINITAFCAALAALSAVSFSASAEGAPKGEEYIGSLQLSRYALTAEEAAAGENPVEISAYIRGAIKDGLIVKNVQAGLDPDAHIYMRNIVDPSITYTENTYSCLGKGFTTAYRPFCFGTLYDNVYNSNTFICSTRDYCMDPISGNYITYQGNDNIAFKLHGRYYVNENGEVAQDKKMHEIICPLEIQLDGSAIYKFQYADVYHDHVEVATATGVISYYQPELLNIGDKLPDINSKLGWTASVNTESSFLGNSNDFPVIQTNAFFKKDTPCGIYEIGFEEDFFRISAELNGSSYQLPMRYYNAAVAVGVTSADMSAKSAIPVYSCYFADDTKTITGASTGFNYICDIEYSDGTSESAKVVTGAVNAGTSPAAIMTNATGNHFIGDIPMYCGDTPLTYNGNENKIKVLIGKKGDVNLDGSVDIEDATAVLKYYAKKAAGLDAELVGGEGFEDTLAFFLGDIDTESQSMDNGGTLNIGDATSILSYYANIAVGNTVSWDQYLQ